MASDGFRNYTESGYKDRVDKHYKLMRTNQTVDFVQRMQAKYTFEDGAYRAKMTIKEACGALENYVDSSDPDMGLPNIVHALQTAEGVRKAGHPDWLQVVALLHDFGKIMYLWGTEEDGQVGTADGPQWALGGDTWVCGCRIPDSVVLPEYNCLNPDMADERYNTERGMYKPGCGLDKLVFTYGHDEYMYNMLLANNTTIPEEGLRMIRYHSAYCWHDQGAYAHLLAPEDEETKRWVKLFNQFDLYTKDEDNALSLDQLWPYYEALLDKYLPGDGDGKLRW